MTHRRSPATAAIHGGRETVRREGAAGVDVIGPVHRSVIYEFETAREFGEVMADARRGYLYTRIRNPSIDELALAVAELEGAEAALPYASGMAAITGALELLAPPGARVVASGKLYGQTYSILRARGDTAFVDVADAAAVAAALDGAAVLYLETVSNPHLDVADIPALAAAAHERGARVLVDNTVATPLGCRPLAHGADLVVHSATKYLNGHSDVLAGVAAGPRDLVDALVERQLDTGATLAPDSAWLVRRGLKTLPLRFERASENAGRIAAALAEHPRVRAVLWPGLQTHPSYDVGRRVLALPGGLLSFEVEGGRAAGEAVMDAARLCIRATSLGGVETTISHPASTSHRQLSESELEASGISPGLLRLSVGCEDAGDLVADLRAALG